MIRTKTHARRLVRPLCNVSAATASRDYSMASDKSHNTYDPMASLSVARPLLLSAPEPKENEMLSNDHTDGAANGSKLLATTETNREYQKAPNYSHSTHKPMGFLSVPQVKQIRTPAPHRFLNTADALKQSTNTERPDSCAAQAKDHLTFLHEKKTMLDDLKEFATNFKIGRRVPPFKMPLNTIGTIRLEESPTSISCGRMASSTAHSMVCVTPSAKQRAAIINVFGTSELLESIVCYLPLKQILDVQRVSKQWRNVIVGSPSIQEKLFTRRANKEQEMWVMERRRDWSHPATEPSALAEYGYIRDSPRRVKVLPPPGRLSITPVIVNPMLQASEHWVTPNGSISQVSTMPHRASVNYFAWANALRYNESCISRMLVTDPPCNRAYIEYLTIYFGNPESRLRRPKPGYFDRDHPKQDPLRVRVSGITVEAASGLTMRDVFKAALHSRGTARCTLSDRTYYERRNTTMYEIIDIMMERLGWISVPESPFMELRMYLSALGSTTILIATEREREIANAQWTFRESYDPDD